MINHAEQFRISRRTFLQAVGLASGAAILAACAPPAAPASGNVPATETSGEQVVNLLWTYLLGNTHQPLLKDFEDVTGIKVNQTQVSYNDMLNRIDTSVQGDADVDVVEMDIVWTAKFATAKWVEDISDKITDAVKNDIPESALSAVMYNGKLYGMPWFNSAKHLFYNEKLTKAAGFDQPPATLDEFVEQAKAMTKAGQWGSIWSWRQVESLICDWVAIMFTNKGAQILDADGKAVFNRMGGTEALQWMVDMLHTHKAADPASLENSEDEVRLALEAGNYALTSNWEGILPEANDHAKSKAAPNVKIGLLPGSKAVKSSSVNGSEGWAILANAKHKGNAWKLLEYMVSPTWQKKAALTIGDYPVLRSLYSDPELAKNIPDFPLYSEQFKYLALRPQVLGYAEKSGIIQRYLHEALLQKMTPQDAMDAAADEVNKTSSAL